MFSDYNRFGKVYWKFNPESVLPPKSSRAEWFDTKLLRKSSFNTEYVQYILCVCTIL